MTAGEMVVRVCPDCGELAGDYWRCEWNLCADRAPAGIPLVRIGTMRTSWNLIRVLPVAAAVEAIAGVPIPEAPRPGFRAGLDAARRAVEAAGGTD